MAQIPLDHLPLFSRRVLDKNLSQEAVPAVHQQLLSQWAATIRDGSLRRRGEQQIRGPFIERFFVKLLGYLPFGSGSAPHTVSEEARTGAGSADAALGHFGPAGDTVVAPVELKGADTPNLDISMPGRQKSPVQQVWEYAMDTPHAKFLVLSNMLEIRVYAVGHTRRVYERFDLLDVADDSAEYHRLMRVLSADQLLGGHTASLLDESTKREREITRELYADYKRWRIQLITALAHANDLAPGALIGPSQKLLDRVLFVAFAQQRGLLPANTLQDVHHSGSAWAPVPRFENYKGLFRAVDQGLPARRIPPYNGGLFAFDALLDAGLRVPDMACDVFLEFSRYDFGGEVSVNVLGHIFEQSITDLEQLQELADTGAFELVALEAQAKSTLRATSGARKEHGIVYTPEFITAFVVEQSLGKTLQERREACAEHFRAEASSAQAPMTWRKPTKEEKAYARLLAQPERVVELAFWRAWQAELTGIKVCDPACGSGAFLVAAFDVLLAEYTNVNEQIAAITGSMEVFHADREILNGNLFGVDLNAESIEITKLSLWLKTARHGKPLESLEANLRVGNSIVSSADGGLAYDPKAFDWSTAFPEIVARGGFDVVIGNPPYVRMERLKAIKPYLEKRYAVAADRADLYCYFFEQAVRLLRNGNAGGRVGFISSSTFFKTNAGQPLRDYLLAQTEIEVVVDFGDLQVFEGVTTYPAILVARRSGAPDGERALRFLNIRGRVPVDLATMFDETAETLQQRQLLRSAWQFEGDARSRLRLKLSAGHPTLKEVYGAPLYGIKTGLNEAFVVDSATRDALVRADPRGAELLKPFLEGRDLKKWRCEPHELWLIYIPKGRIEIDDFPAIKAHLLPFKGRLEKRATQQAWFELQQSQQAYVPLMEARKLVYTRFMAEPTFWLDVDDHCYLNNALNFVAGVDCFELGLLNSRALWFVLRDSASTMSGGFVQVHGHVLERCPIPTAAADVRARVAGWASSAQTAAQARHREIKRFGRTVLRDFAPGGAKLPAAWDHVIPEFTELCDEIDKRFKRELRLAERNDWDAAVTRARAKVAELDATVARCEQWIDGEVYRLFDLSPAEVALIESA